MRPAHAIAFTAAAALAAVVSGNAEAQTMGALTDAWTWHATIYGWFPSVNSTTNVAIPGRGTLSVDVDPGTYLSHLDFAFMGNLEARKGPWSFIGDAVYFNFGNIRSDPTAIRAPDGSVVPVTANTHTDIKGFLGSIGVGYALIQTPSSNVDLVAGARYLQMKVGVDYEVVDPFGSVPARGNLSRTKDLWDGIVGIRGRVDLGGEWFVPFHADMGAGTSQFTWQAFGGVGYRFKWGDVRVGYRHVSYRFDGDNPLSALSFGGPLVGVGFKF